ncbi:MAG: hypothetical protein RXP86_11910 [Acidilobus sp.]|jgi:uncharacterized membrane protein (DUF485 family)
MNIKERLVDALPQLFAIQFFAAIALLVLSLIHKSLFMVYLALWLMLLDSELYILHDLYDLKEDLRSDNLERWYTARKRLKSDKEAISMLAASYLILHIVAFLILIFFASLGTPITLTSQEAGTIFLLALTVIIFVPATVYTYADRLTRLHEVRA